MDPVCQPVPSPLEQTPLKPTEGRLLSSGRSVILKTAGDHEELEIRSPAGDVEVRITLTEGGAVVQLRGGRLELESPDTVALNCRRFEVNTAEGTRLESAGDLHIAGREMNVNTTGDIRLKGGVIHLN